MKSQSKDKTAAKTKADTGTRKLKALPVSLRGRWPLGGKRKKTKTPLVTRPLPGYIGFTRQVFAQLKADRRLFSTLFLITIIGAAVLFGATQQDQYVTTTDMLRQYGETFADKGFDTTVRFGVLLATAATGGLNTTLSETQRVYFFIFYLLICLVTIWLLRHRMAGVSVTVRDGLYSAGAPLVASLVLFFVAMIQLLPMAMGVIVYSAAMSSGALSNPLETGLFAVGAFLLSILSLYWISSTLFAFIIASNPGTYPFAAMRTASRIVAGKRLKLVMRLVWLAVLLLIVWAIVLIPAVLLDSWIAQPLLPIVVLSIQLLMGFSVIFGTSYVYLLYRKMIDEPTS